MFIRSISTWFPLHSVGRYTPAPHATSAALPANMALRKAGVEKSNRQSTAPQLTDQTGVSHLLHRYLRDQKTTQLSHALSIAEGWLQSATGSVKSPAEWWGILLSLACRFSHSIPLR